MAREREREALIGWRSVQRGYSQAAAQRWRAKVKSMSDTQVTAIFLRLKRAEQI